MSQPLSVSEVEVDLVLIQTSFLFLWKLCLKNTSLHKENMIYIRKQEGLYQNKVNSSLQCRRILGGRNVVRVVAAIFDFITVEDWGE